MLDFRDGAAENQIKGFSTYFDAINYPAQPLSAESKVFFNNFFGGEGFVTFCDLLFGPYYDRYGVAADELCWMDYANIAPRKGTATALSALINPNSGFISTLEALSTPSSTFSTQLRKGWKNATEPRSATSLCIDLPLSAIYPLSYQLMAESAETNLYQLPRSRLPPALLVPFWEPPVVTRKELSQQQVLTSLPCTPMGYFVLRLLLFGLRRVQANAANYLTQRRSSAVVTWMRHLKEASYAVFYKAMPTEMPYYTQLLQTYIQVYVSPSLPRHLSSKTTIVDVSWTSCDVVAVLLVMAPFLLAHRQVQQPVDEITRFGCTNPEALAQLVSIVPLHTSMVYALLQSGGDSAAADSRESIALDFSVSASSKAQNDLESIRSTLFRNCLVLLRECLLSLELEPHCKAAHFTYCLELWAVLLSPCEKQQPAAAPQYVVHHFEAFSFITIDVLNMIVKSSFVRSMTEDSVRVLKKCFCLLSQPCVVNLLTDIHASQPPLRSVADTVSRHFVLNWARSDGNVQIPDLLGNTTCNLAARAYVVLERLLEEDVSELFKSDVREALSFMMALFPSLASHLASWRASAKSTFSGAVSGAPRPSADAKQLTDAEKSLFFRGSKAARKSYAKNLRLPTRNGRLPGGHHPALQTSLRDEVPVLLTATRIFDAVIVKALELYHTSLIPKCENGHNLWLVYSKSYACKNHLREPALWECTLCEAVFGSCCRSLPCRSDGERCLVYDGAVSASHQCCYCGQVVPDGCNLFYLETKPDVFLCPDCASRPFRAPSVRVLAAYSTWAAIIVAVVVYYVVLLLSS